MLTSYCKFIEYFPVCISQVGSDSSTNIQSCHLTLIISSYHYSVCCIGLYQMFYMYSQSLLEPVAMCYHLCITDKSNVLAESSSVF